MNNVVYQIATLIISLIGVVLTSLVVPLVKTKVNKNKLTIAEMWVNVAVAAAEQIFSAPQQGTNKKKYVIEFLNSKGITLTEEELNVLIEAAVYELNRAKDMLFIEEI
ncbi:MAG TPA: holin [Clostridiales bacterium]|jgi:hypothetical protein|nr:holin [Clostridiales bacterium]